METSDIVGARPRSRPGYGMGHYTLGNGMMASYRTTRETNPLQPAYKLPHHTVQHATVPVSHSTYNYAPKTARMGSTMDCSDIPGSTSPRRKVRTTAYNVLDYSDVNGTRFYSPRAKGRQWYVRGCLGRVGRPGLSAPPAVTTLPSSLSGAQDDLASSKS